MSKYEHIQKAAYDANMQLPKLGLVLFTFGNVSAVDRKLELRVRVAVVAKVPAADDEMNTSREPARMRGSTAAVTTKHESRLAEMIARHCSNVCLRA